MMILGKIKKRDFYKLKKSCIMNCSGWVLESGFVCSPDANALCLADHLPLPLADGQATQHLLKR
jgi:hypothetical protein